MLKQMLALFTATFLICGATFSQNRDSVTTKPFATQKLASYLAPAVFISYGAISLTGDNFIRKLDFSTHAELKEDHPLFSVKLDNYMRYAPLAAVYGLDLLGVKAKHNFTDRSLSLLLSVGIMTATVSTLKGATNRVRPNGDNAYSFPSGHTATAFMIAEFLNQEYKHKSVWYSVAGYGLAASTGVFRMYNKAHWVSDVVAGAGFGILSTKLAYIIYPEIKTIFSKRKANHLMVMPSYQQGVKSIALTYRFGH